MPTATCSSRPPRSSSTPPDEYKDTVWQVHKDVDGVEWLTMEDMKMEAAVMAFAAAGGEEEDERVSKHSGERGYTDLPDYCWEAKARLKALDAEDMQQSVLYPTMLLTFQHLRSLPFAEMQCQARTTTGCRTCAPRARAACTVSPSSPTWTPTAPAAEIRRVATLPHIVGVQVRPNPAMDYKHLNHEVYEPTVGRGRGDRPGGGHAPAVLRRPARRHPRHEARRASAPPTSRSRTRTSSGPTTSSSRRSSATRWT